METITKLQNYKGIEVMRDAFCGRNVKQQIQDYILDKIMEHNVLEISPRKLENEIDFRMLEWQHQMQYECLSSGDVYAFLNEDMAEKREEFRREAVRELKVKMIIDGIIEAEKLQVTEEELEEEAQAIATRQNMSLDMVKSFLGPSLLPVKRDILMRKAMDFIYVNAVIS